MTVELKACPFCGGKARMTGKRRGNYRREGTNYQALCGSCKARGPLVQDTPEKAAEAWNSLVSDAPVSYEEDRAQFEAAYLKEFNESTGSNEGPQYMVGMRVHGSYGPDRHYLNGAWWGWRLKSQSSASNARQ